MRKVNRSLPQLKLTRSPLVCVLADIRLAPVLKTDERIDKIQEILRILGFDNYIVSSFKIESFDQNHSKTSEEIKTLWQFLSPDKTTLIQIDNCGVCVLTSDYQDYDQFAQVIKLALDTSHQIRNHTTVMRIGLRYVDAIEDIDGVNRSELVVKDLLGTVNLKVPEASSLSRLTECLLQTGEKSFFRIRAQDMNMGLAIPLDLLPTPLGFKKDPSRKDFILLDLDHFLQNEFAFQTNSVLDELDKLHDAHDHAFRSVTTEPAIKIWQTA